ncbi:sensor domain-containing protein [Gottfriedia luciferensis]|uniref:sensor domain-containing protein n=1 Tax=Gottfriedia luciferensis TaxID=178774 RepID=UPI001F177597|nr:EAL domain-containing protein [Gottfriedia luciferensis]
MNNKTDMLNSRSLTLIVMAILIELVATFLFLHNRLALALVNTTFTLVILLIVILLLKFSNKNSNELRKDRQRLDHIFDTLDVAIWSHDLKTNTLLITPGIENLYGYSLEKFYQDSTLWKKVIHPEDLKVLEERERILSLGKTVTSIYRIIRSDGEVRWIQDRGIPTVDERGSLIDFCSVLFDITNRKESEDRYRTLVEMSPDIIAVYSRGRIDYINEAGCKLFGASNQKDLIGKPPSKLIHPNILREIKDNELDLDDSKSMMRFEFQANRLNGESIEVEMTTMPIFYEGRAATQIVGRDISDRKRAEHTIQHMAYYDVLTGLPNRNKFRKHLNEVLSQSTNQKHAILFLDLDRFKIINDTKGHTVGDQLLQSVAKRIESAINNKGMVSRQGGDEFIILLENKDTEKVIEVAKSILREFATPFDVDHLEFFVTPSIGISMYPADGEDEETLIKNADTAMYLAKERGKNNYQFYSSKLAELATQKMDIEKWLRRALEKDELKINYQPQIDLETNEIIGVEALLRWHHPEKGMISPADFIPLAEETGLIVPIGKWILKEACLQNKKWQEEGFKPIPIAVNISVRQIQDEEFIESVTRILDEVGLKPNLLDLEITESIMQDIEKSTNVLNQLKKIGLKISIDDFGTGYSSLSYLKHLPIDSIKIDKSFVDDIINHSTKGEMVKTIIDMGHNLNFNVIAEGIEKKEQVEFLKQNQCNIGQGYFYSKPIPVNDLEKLLSRV